MTSSSLPQRPSPAHISSPQIWPSPPSYYAVLAANLLLYIAATAILVSIAIVVLNWFHLLPVDIDMVAILKTLIIPICSIGILGTVLSAAWTAVRKAFQNPLTQSLKKVFVTLAILLALVTTLLLCTTVSLLPKRPLFYDPLDHYSSQWQTSSPDRNTICSTSVEKVEALYVAVNGNKKQDWAMCYVPTATYTDLKYQVQMTILQGGDFGGIVFRGTGVDDDSDFYYIVINNEGEYLFQKAFHNQVREQEQIQPIATGYTAAYRNLESNQITAFARGDSFQFLVNDKLVFTAIDTTFSRAGYIGVIADNSASLKTAVLFNDATVWSN
jgi:hypothetical protein